MSIVSRKKTSKEAEQELQYLISDKSDKSKVKVQVDRKFFVHLSQLFKVVVPGWSTPESGMFFLIALSLIARSVCDLWMIDQGTKIER